MSKKSNSTSDAVKREYLVTFSREAPHIREAILRDLPAYNMLISSSLNAETFEEIALRKFAEERGEPYNKLDPPVPDCPFCGSREHVRKKEQKKYICTSCENSPTFSANYNSISSGTKQSALTWMKVLYCILQGMNMSRTIEYCDIEEATYYNIRRRLAYAMSVQLLDLKLYGEIEVDNTFVRASYKGKTLRQPAYEFPEDSEFYDSSFKPRAPRARGGAYSSADKNANMICIFTGIDDRGHVVARYSGFGNTSCSALKAYVPKEKFLHEVPKKDPFSHLMKKQNSEPKTKVGEASLMVSDKEGAIRKFATGYLDINFESHVYRRNGVQLKQSPARANIQRVNALHRRLKDYLRICGSVSTKYLPMYLTTFEWLSNTGGTQAAIDDLFKTLATPNLGRPPEFYRNQYSVPDYLEEWLDVSEKGDFNVLKKIPYNKILAYYLYDQFRNRDTYPNRAPKTMEEIEDRTGYSAPTIRKTFRELDNAGYRDIILAYFGKKEKGTDANGSQRRKGKRFAPTSFTAEVLSLYDEYAKIRTMPHNQRPSLEAFLKEKNQQYGTNFKRTNLLAKFKLIEEAGLRTPLPELQRREGKRWTPPDEICMAILAAYDQIVLRYREKGEKPPISDRILEELSADWEYSPSSLHEIISYARGLRRKQREKSTDTNPSC